MLDYLPQSQPGVGVPPSTPIPASAPTSNSEPDETSDEVLRKRAFVKQWQTRIHRAEAKWEKDFERMVHNMEFATGLQWEGQCEMDYSKYINNITLRMVHQKVATLYAKNPTFVATRRERLDYQIWDGKTESLMSAIQKAQQITMTGQPLPLELRAFFVDVEQGKLRERMIEKVAKTLEIIFGYFVDSQKPEFKQQLKKAVIRACVCGVAYCRPIFCRETEQYSTISSVDPGSTTMDRANRAQVIIKRVQEAELNDDSATLETLKSLAASLGVGEMEGFLPERLEFDFPEATSIIVDERCRSLIDFVAARWIAQKYILPVEEVNAIFGTSVKAGGGDKAVEKQLGQASSGYATSHDPEPNKDDLFDKQYVCVYEVFDYTTKTCFFICDGWKDFLEEPAPRFPRVNGFWEHFTLVFNECEVVPDSKASIYPPSDVQLVKHPQKEWNRTRSDLRDQRRANSPKWTIRKGMFTGEDLQKIRDAVPNEVLEISGGDLNQPIENHFGRLPAAPIDPAMYDTDPLAQDMMMATGMQEANVGPAQPNVTATVGTIAEQSRLNVSASNIDDLDGFLSRIAQASGEMLLQELDETIAKRIAGPGAVWPSLPQLRQDFLNEVYLEIEAASSGRPNKAVDVANWRDLAPLLLQSGANPVGVIEETARRLDDRMSTSQFYPLLPSALGGGNGPPATEGMAPEGSEAPQNPNQNPQQAVSQDQSSTGAPVPALAGGSGPQEY